MHWASRHAMFISMWQDTGHEMDMGNSGVDFILSLVSGLAQDPVRRQLIIGWNPSRRRCWFNLVCVCVILTPCLALIGPHQTWSAPWAPEAHGFKECGGINPVSEREKQFVMKKMDYKFKMLNFFIFTVLQVKGKKRKEVFSFFLNLLPWGLFQHSWLFLYSDKTARLGLLGLGCWLG